jgi:hypothetical protein
MHGAIPPLPKYDFMDWCLVKHKDLILSSHLRLGLRVVSSHQLLSYYNVLCSGDEVLSSTDGDLAAELKKSISVVKWDNTVQYT